jgi:hypothetical protein
MFFFLLSILAPHKKKGSFMPIFLVFQDIGFLTGFYNSIHTISYPSSNYTSCVPFLGRFYFTFVMFFFDVALVQRNHWTTTIGTSLQLRFERLARIFSHSASLNLNFCRCSWRRLRHQCSSSAECKSQRTETGKHGGHALDQPN